MPEIRDELEQAFREGYECGIGDKNRTDAMIKEIADHYGLEQLQIAMEECTELNLAILKLKRGWSEKRQKNIVEEIADTLIMVLQLRYIFGADKVDEVITQKLVRQLERIEEEQSHDDR